MKATFGAGCFWHVEEAYRKLKGVTKTNVGYMGGDVKNPSYEEVCRKNTGHIEVCQVEYDEEKISYDKLVKLFFKIHDATQMNRQGLDIGIQYKSIIFYYNDEQKKIAEKILEKEQTKSKKRIVTDIRKAEKFWKAEEYHQKYLMKRGRNTC